MYVFLSVAGNALNSHGFCLAHLTFFFVHCGGGVLAGKMATNLGKVILLFKMNFPGGPMAKTPTPNSEGTGLIPGWGAKVWLAARTAK